MRVCVVVDRARVSVSYRAYRSNFQQRDTFHCPCWNTCSAFCCGDQEYIRIGLAPDTVSREWLG